MAPFCFIQCRAAEVSSPPEKAMPTFWPMGRDSRITDMLGNLSQGAEIRGQRSRNSRTTVDSTVSIVNGNRGNHPFNCRLIFAFRFNRDVKGQENNDRPFSQPPLF